jgi:hypothetical protein
LAAFLQDELFSVDDDGVAGVMPAGVAGDYGKALREDVDNFSFAFVAPLRADDDPKSQPKRILPIRLIDLKLNPGRRGRDRTCNPGIRNPVLYPIELRAHDNLSTTIDSQNLS